MNTCVSCNFTGSDVAVCSGCKCAFYCGTACQRRDWQARHQDECHLLAEMCAIAASLADTANNKDADAENRYAYYNKLWGSSSKNIAPSTASLIEGGIKRVPDTSPAKLERDTLQQQQQEQPAAIYLLNRDMKRLIALMVRLDGPNLAKTSRAFRDLYWGIDWRARLLTLWDLKPIEFAKPIGQWLQDYRVYLLYPEMGLPERVVSPEQQERLDAIEAERNADEEEGIFRTTLDEEAAAIERQVFRDRFFALPSMAGPVQQGIVNLFMLYYMYEENCITHQGYCPADDDAEGFSADESADEPADDGEDEKSHLGPMRKITQNLDIRPYRAFTAPEPAYFPVEMLTAPLFDEYILGGAAYNGPRPDCVLSMALASDVIRRLQAARQGAIDHSVSLAFVKNFPKALVKCSSIVNALEVRKCPPFSDASMQNIANMKNVEEAVFDLDERWETFTVDMYATMPLLERIQIGARLPCRLASISVSPSIMQESPLAPGLYGACSPTGRQMPITGLMNAATERAFENFEPLNKPARRRVLPPGPYAGMSYSGYTRRILREAFATEDIALHDRLVASLEKAGLMLSSPMQYEGEDYAEDFIVALEASGISALKTSKSQDVLPFRFWFYKGVPHYFEGREEVFPSLAVDMCTRSALERSGPTGIILLEEMAEAVCGWQVSVRNLKVVVKSGVKRAPTYDYFMDFAGGVIEYPIHDGMIRPRSWVVKANSTRPYELPWEIVARVIRDSTEHVKLKSTSFIKFVFSGWQGKIPTWLWLAPKELSSLVCVDTKAFGLPAQLMYHPGLTSLSVRGSKFGELNWEMVHVAPAGRPARSQDPWERDTYMHQYFHDFERLWIEVNGASVTCFPPLDLTTYTVGINLQLSE